MTLPTHSAVDLRAECRVQAALVSLVEPDAFVAATKYANGRVADHMEQVAGPITVELLQTWIAVAVGDALLQLVSRERVRDALVAAMEVPDAA